MWYLVIIAFAVGAVLGVLFGRKNTKKVEAAVAKAKAEAAKVTTTTPA
jgi:uncharacterized membrane-anchored protein YhcB (DUF1043 family)